MPGGCSKREQRLRGQRPVLVENLAFRYDKIPARAQNASIGLDPSAGNRFQIIDSQLHGHDFSSSWHRRIRRDRRRGIRQRRQDSSVHHAMHLLVAGPNVQSKYRAPLMHALNFKPKKFRRAAFFHPPPHEFGDPLFFLRHSLGHRVSPIVQYAESPPSSGNAAPVTHDDSSDARNTAISATSAGRPIRPSGILTTLAFRSACPRSLSSNSPVSSSVSTIDGQMQFTRTFSCAWSMAIAFVSIVTPPFDAQYAARSFIAISPRIEPIFTIAPPCAFRNSGSTARDIRNGPLTLTVITRPHSSSLMPSTVETCSAPALFTSTFRRPNRSTVPFTARSTSRACVTSHSIANPAPPSFWISRATSRIFSSRRPATATPAPSRANASAIARPIPVPPPVISATLPASRVTFFPAPASNRMPRGSLRALRGGRDSSIRFPGPQAAGFPVVVGGGQPRSCSGGSLGPGL